MTLAIETVSLCLVFFLLCYPGTGTDEKNLKSYASYPDAVQDRVKSIAEYQGKFREGNKAASFISNLLIFLILLFALGLFIREKSFLHNFLCLSVLGQGFNLFDLLIIDLSWWRNTERIRFSKIPEKELYQSPKKHMESFGRAIAMYLLVAVIDGYLLTLI